MILRILFIDVCSSCARGIRRLSRLPGEDLAVLFETGAEGGVVYVLHGDVGVEGLAGRRGGGLAEHHEHGAVPQSPRRASNSSPKSCMEIRASDWDCSAAP